jgi:hypothetical protein
MNENCYSKSKLSPIFAPVKVLVKISVCVCNNEAGIVREDGACLVCVGDNFFMPKFGGMEKMVYLCGINSP